MRGIPLYNFPAFDEAAATFRKLGWEVISPAELDRTHGVNEHTDPLPPNFLRRAMERDLSAICYCDAVAVLPGWESSKGTAVEIALAALIGIPVVCAKTGQPIHRKVDVTYSPVEPESILEEAWSLTRGQRNTDYGHPYDDYLRVVGAFNVLTGHQLKVEEGPIFMLCVKLAREAHKHKRDNNTDIAGYADVKQRIEERKVALKEAA